MSKLNSLRKLTGAVDQEYDPLAPDNCLRSSSPSVNWVFGHKGHGLPLGYGMILYGPPKGGKSILCNDFIGTLHRTDPTAETVTFNTELRGQLQANADQMRLWGIDPERHITFDVNEPENIFDRIEKDLVAYNQKGGNIKLIIIDSLSNIRGRRSLNATTVNQQQIGDQALTLKDGLERIVPALRRNKIALILTAHVRAELDPHQQMRGKMVKMQSAWATKHLAEFFVYVERNETVKGRESLTGEKFVNDSIEDFSGKNEIMAHKIRVRMDDSSVNGRKRAGEFTLHYNKGLINKHEEIFLLGKALGLITNPKQGSYQIGEESWRGVASVVQAIKENPELQSRLEREIFIRDREIIIKGMDDKVEDLLSTVTMEENND